MSGYIFGLGHGWLDSHEQAKVEKHGARLVNFTHPECSCGQGCKPYECKRSRRHWLVVDNRGEPNNLQVASGAMEEP